MSKLNFPLQSWSTAPARARGFSIPVCVLLDVLAPLHPCSSFCKTPFAHTLSQLPCCEWGETVSLQVRPFKGRHPIRYWCLWWHQILICATAFFSQHTVFLLFILSGLGSYNVIFGTALAELLVPCSSVCITFMRSLLLYLSSLSPLLFCTTLSSLLSSLSFLHLFSLYIIFQALFLLVPCTGITPPFQTSLFSSHKPLPTSSIFPPHPPFQPYTKMSSSEFLLAKNWCSSLGNSFPLKDN